LDWFGGSKVPKFGTAIRTTREEEVLVDWVEREGHNLSFVIFELGSGLTCFHIPVYATVISGCGDHFLIVDKFDGTDEASVSREFLDGSDWRIFSFDVIDVADVVETTASDVTSRR
jgi:hypothetical protein